MYNGRLVDLRSCFSDGFREIDKGSAGLKIEFLDRGRKVVSNVGKLLDVRPMLGAQSIIVLRKF